MTETLALEGLGAKIRFNASGFESDLIALTLSPKARATIDTTHLGTDAAKTKRPGQTQDLGTIEAVFDHDPAAVSLVGRPAEQVIITYPEDLGHEFDPIVLWAFATEQGGERMFPDGRMVTNVVLRLSVPDAVAAESAPEPPALADPTKWIGAWDFESPGIENIVSAAPSGAMILDGTWSRDIGTGLSGSFGVGKYTPNFRGGVYTNPSMSTVDLSSFTCGWFASVTGPGRSRFGFSGGNDFSLGSQMASVYSTTVSLANNYLITDGTYHHYCFQYDSTNGAWRVLRDATVLESGFISAGLSLSGSNIFISVDDETWLEPSSADNAFLTGEYLSDAAISALALGAMPDALGNLS